MGGDDGGRYPLTGVGDVNTYALFAETILQIHASTGRAGFIVPTGIATDDSTKAFFGHITQRGRLVSLYDIENREKLFAAVDSRMKFSLLTLGDAELSEFVCFVTQVDQLADLRRRFTLSPDEFRLINPNTLTCPIFRSERDAELTKKLYRAAPILIEDGRVNGNRWGFDYMTKMFDMADSSHEFIEYEQMSATECAESSLSPLREAKHIHIYDHRWATSRRSQPDAELSTAEEKSSSTFVIATKYWLAKNRVEERLASKGWKRGWLMGWRDITNATNERTVIAAVFPRTAIAHTLRVAFIEKPPRQAAAFIGNLSTLVLDYSSRQKIGGTHLTVELLKQLPVLPPDHYTDADIAFIVPRVLELTYTAYDLSDWAKDLGYDGAPFAFDLGRRAILRAELDAYYARLYGLTRDELRYILDPADVMGKDYPSETFRVLKNNERIPGTEQYRTQQLVLAAWDALEVRHPITAPEPKPVRRRAPLPIYAEGTTPASTAEDWLGGLVFEILQQAGPCDDNQLRRLLGARLPDGTPDAEVLHAWLAPVNTERWGHICSWLRALLGVPVTAPLSIRDAQAQAEVLGDHRTESLARALIAARRQQESALAEALAGSTSEVRPDEIRKQG